MSELLTKLGFALTDKQGNAERREGFINTRVYNVNKGSEPVTWLAPGRCRSFRGIQLPLFFLGQPRCCVSESTWRLHCPLRPEAYPPHKPLQDLSQEEENWPTPAVTIKVPKDQQASVGS